LNQGIDEALRHDVGTAVIERPDVPVAIEGREETAHIRGENSEQRHAPQNIDKNDALCKADGANTLRFRLHAPPSAGHDDTSNPNPVKCRVVALGKRDYFRIADLD
jgi:hypothetical protein